MYFYKLSNPIKVNYINDTVVYLGISFYADNRALAILLYDENKDFLADLTVNLDLNDTIFFVDDDSFYVNATETAHEVTNVLLKTHKLSYIMTTRPSGFNSYNAYQIIDPAILSAIKKAKEELAKHEA